MSADIARVVSERPELDEELVRGMYNNFVFTQRQQPSIDELRSYVDRVSSLDQDELRQRLGLGRRRRGTRPKARRLSPPKTLSTVAAGDGGSFNPGSAARGPGRPGWTSELFSTRYQAALDRATPPYTHQSIADQFEMLDGSVGPDPDHLRKLLKRYGRPPG